MPDVDLAVLSENPSRTVWRLAGPAVALNLLQVVNSLLDGFFVGALDRAALTATGAAASVTFLLFSLGFALGTAPTAIVARAFGAGHFDDVKLASRKCFGVAVWTGVVVCGLGYLVLRPAADWLTPTEDIRARALMIQYMSLYITALPAFFVIQSLAGALRGIGDTKSPMVISGIQICLHITLNLLLINKSHVFFGHEFRTVGLGLPGAGIAVSVSAWVSAIGYVLWTIRTPLGFCVPHSVPDAFWVRRIFRIAIPAAMMSIVRVASFIALTKVLTLVPQGSDALAALRIGISVESIAFMPAFGLSVAAQALVGQSLGMVRPDRAMRLGWLSAHHSAWVSALLSILLVAFSYQIASVLIPSQSASVILLTSSYIFYVGLTEVLFSYGVVLVGAMQGAGDTVRPMWLTVLTLWFLRVPLGAALALSTPLGARGVWISFCITQMIQGVAAMFLWKQGKWADREV